MLSLSALVLLFALPAAGETVLIDFSAEWCGPCKQMEPTVDRLAQMGYPVRKVNIDHDKDLARRFQIGSIPCFVLVVDGREADRQVGGTSFENLQWLLAKHGVTPGSQIRDARGQSPDNNPRPMPAQHAAAPAVAQPAQRAIDPALDQLLLAASVRLKVEDPQGNGFGSGTIVDFRGDEALVLTCGHLFRDSNGKGRVTIDMFGPGAPQHLPAQVLTFDLKADVALVSFRPGVPVQPVSLAASGYAVRRGDEVIAIGCSNGDDPTVQHSRVTSIDKFLGPPNLQVAGQPVQGRSGGGLFNDRGQVIGVCNAADPADNEGLYAAGASIWAELRKANQQARQPRNSPGRDVVPPATDDHLAAAPRELPKMPQRLTEPVVATAAVVSSEIGPLSRDELAALTAANRSREAEVICIVRSSDDPRAKSEVVVLDKASQNFLRQLASERSSQGERRLTSLEVPPKPTIALVAKPARGVPPPPPFRRR